MNRVLFADGAILRPRSEYDTWDLATRKLWKEADTITRKNAVAARWRLRRAEKPKEWPLPTEPLALALCLLELSYRADSPSRGAVRDD